LPPKYGSSDFSKVAYWRQRGKYDVPGQTFISYPDVESDDLLLGSPAWTDGEQAQVLADLIGKLSASATSDRDRLLPLLVGLQEMLPWAEQWAPGLTVGKGPDAALTLREFLTQRLNDQDLAWQDLQDWQPKRSKRGRPRKATRSRSTDA
jgi:hypothetical protein